MVICVLCEQEKSKLNTICTTHNGIRKYICFSCYHLLTLKDEAIQSIQDTSKTFELHTYKNWLKGVKE